MRCTLSTCGFDQHVCFLFVIGHWFTCSRPGVGIDNSDWEGEREMEADQKVMSYFFSGDSERKYTQITAD